MRHDFYELLSLMPCVAIALCALPGLGLLLAGIACAWFAHRDRQAKPLCDAAESEWMQERIRAEVAEKAQNQGHGFVAQFGEDCAKSSPPSIAN